jgi:erythromycin esterase
MIGEAPIVATTEAIHLGAEPLEFRNRLFEYLVQEKGFTAIAIESGIVESRTVYEYVRGGPGKLSQVVADGVSWTFDRLPQNESLIRWMTRYNADPAHVRKINFYGFDVPGSPGNVQARRGLQTALSEALRYLERVDAAASAQFRGRLDPVWQKLRFDPSGAGETPGYESLAPQARDALTATVADLIDMFERNEAAYTAASSSENYEWSYRSAIAARQVDNWLRHIPLNDDTRDRAQADNLEWIIRREGPAGKVLVFAARYHLSAAPVLTNWATGGEPRQAQQVAGTYLRRRYGARYVNIGNLISSAQLKCGEDTLDLSAESSQSWAGIFRQVGSPAFLLDLRAAPAPVKRFLDQMRPLGQDQRLTLGSAFDVLFYLDTASSACTQ